MQSRRQVIAAAGALALAGPTIARGQPAGDGAEAQLSKLMDAFFAEALAESPELATSLGLDTGARAQAKARLHDASLAGVARRRALNADQLRRLKAIDRGQLAGMAAVNYDTLLFDLQTTDDANRRFAYGGQGAGTPYVLSQINGAYQEVPDFLATQHTIETRADAAAIDEACRAAGLNKCAYGRRGQPPGE